MANNQVDPSSFDSYEDYKSYMEYASQAQAHNGAIQQAGPQPFQPADNQSKVKAAQVMAGVPAGIRAQAHSPDETAQDGAKVGWGLPAAGLGMLLGKGITAGAGKAADVVENGVGSTLKQGLVKLLRGVSGSPDALESAGASGVPVKPPTMPPESLASGLEGGSPIDPSRIKLDANTGAINPNKPKWDFPIRKRGLGVE